MADSSEPPTQLEQSEQVCSFFRKPSKGKKNIRKRTAVEEGENEGEDSKAESIVIYNKKKPTVVDNKLHFSCGPTKRSMLSESDLEPKAPVFQYKSSKEIQVQNDSRATATLETETEFSRDARAIRERVLKKSEEALKGKKKSDSDEKLYKGIHGYTDYKAGFRREQTVASEKAGGAHGPLRASAYIRVSARFDYLPDICKDYKETGYCGYGDSCKFLHDRGITNLVGSLRMSGMKERRQEKKALALGMTDDDEGDAETSDEDGDDSLPFACFLCREPFVDPVETKCKHYFCEHCAVKARDYHHAKSKKCFVCNQPISGIFNTAFELRKKMAERK